MDKIRLILAEDHAVVRQGTKQLLQRYPDLEVVGEAVDGEEAVAMVKQRKPDVAILDVRMPRMTGIEATRKIKAECPDVAILILTAHDDDEYVFALLEAGANGYLLKTAEIEELVKAIHAVHAGQPALDPLITRKVVSQFMSGKSLPDVMSRSATRWRG